MQKTIRGYYCHIRTRVRGSNGSAYFLRLWDRFPSKLVPRPCPLGGATGARVCLCPSGARPAWPPTPPDGAGGAVLGGEGVGGCLPPLPPLDHCYTPSRIFSLRGFLTFGFRLSGIMALGSCRQIQRWEKRESPAEHIPRKSVPNGMLLLGKFVNTMSAFLRRCSATLGRFGMTAEQRASSELMISGVWQDKSLPKGFERKSSTRQN